MSIKISRETEACISEEARKQGVSVDALLELLVKERAATTQPAKSQPELQVWHLGSVGSLHRRDIYDDAG